MTASGAPGSFGEQEPPPDLDRLMAEFLAGVITPEDEEAFFQVLRGNAELRRELCSLTEIDNALLHLGRTRKESDREQAAQLISRIEMRLGTDARLLEKVLGHLEPPPGAEGPDRKRIPGSWDQGSPGLKRPQRSWWIAIPIAACLAITFGVILHDRIPNGTSHPIRSSATTIAFQDGSSPRSDYSGTRDTWINSERPASRYGQESTVEVEDSDEKPGGRPALLRWDVTAIPPGSKVRSVTLALSLVKASGERPCHLYEMNRDWSENDANWTRASRVEGWETPGAQGAKDRGGSILGTFLPRAGKCAITLDAQGVTLVQSWIDVPDSNHGLLLAIPENEGKFTFHSRESSQASNRPMLTVTYEETGR